MERKIAEAKRGSLPRAQRMVAATAASSTRSEGRVLVSEYARQGPGTTHVMAGFHFREHGRNSFGRDHASKRSERYAQQLKQHHASYAASERARIKVAFPLQLGFLDVMPRQLPWLTNGGGGRAKAKQSPTLRTDTKALSNIDDDFFDGTVLASSSKGKGNALQDDEDSNEDLPDLPAELSTMRTKSKTTNASRKNRAPSSSPPPIADHVQPQIEYMRTGASKFDLRDDEWMMVEDEFLETAKLFTRHLHIAEYEKLKDRIEAKKKEQVQAMRPVVAGEKLSVEGTMKKKAEVQAKRQHKAIRDVFASRDDEDEEGNGTTASNRTATPTLKQPPLPATSEDTDSDDLDASHPPVKQANSRLTTSKPKPAPAMLRSTGLKSASLHTTGPKPASSADPTHRPASTTPSFAKPALPAARPRGTARKSRFNIDMLDDYVPPANRTSSTDEIKVQASPSPARSRIDTPLKLARSSSPIKPAAASAEKNTNGTAWGSGLSKETAERLAKRKAERETEKEGKKKNVKLEDIPTFLV